MELVSFMKSTDNNVMVSSIIVQEDNLNEKGSCVNFDLARMCHESNIGHLDNSNISLDHILRGRKYRGNYLNERGLKYLDRTLLILLILDHGFT